MKIDKNHPRAESLHIRENLVLGVSQGIASYNGLIAHGRGEAFDYLIGEKTTEYAQKAITAAAVLLVSAHNPVLSMNGNIAALCTKEYITLARLLQCPIEVNVFHADNRRKKLIKKKLEKQGFTHVLGVTGDRVELPGIASERKWVSRLGIFKSDVVLVPLEDGDRCGALKQAGKTVITIDLNPLSRTAQMADVTIVDNIVRCLPRLILEVSRLQTADKQSLRSRVKRYNNHHVLKSSLQYIFKRLDRIGDTVIK